MLKIGKWLNSQVTARVRSLFLLVGVGLFLSACGGGKSGSSSSLNCTPETMESSCIVSLIEVHQKNPDNENEVTFTVQFSQYGQPFKSGSLQWDFDSDGQFDASYFCTDNHCPEVTYVYSSGVTNTARLRVTVVDGEEGLKVEDLDYPVVFPPKANFTFAPDSPMTSQVVSFSADPNANYPFEVAYSWDFNYNGAAPNFDLDNSTAEAKHVYSEAGNYRVLLRVEDSLGVIVETANEITVSKFEEPLSQSPVAVVTLNGTTSNNTVAAGRVLSADASASSDDGTIESYEWDYNNDGIVDNTGETIQLSYDTAGEYSLKLKVTDDSGLSGETQVTIAVVEAPVIALKVSLPNPFIGDTVEFTDLSTSPNPNGSIVSREWDFTDDGIIDSTDPVAQTSYAIAGTYVIRLRVTDNSGISSESITNITASEISKQSPVAVFSLSHVSVAPNQLITGDASESSDDGSIVSYEWDYTDDGVIDGSGANLEFSYATGGEYTVRLRVTDNDGLTGEATQKVNVLFPPAPDFIFSPSSPLIGQAISFTDTSTSPNVGGLIVSSEWDFLDYGSFDINGAYSQYTFDTAGTYNVRLRVTDNAGLSSEITKAIDVVTQCDVVPGISIDDPFDLSQGTIVTADDVQQSPENAFSTCSGFENGHSLMADGALSSTSFINFQSNGAVDIQGIRLFAASNGSAEDFKQAMNKFRLLADLDSDGIFESILVDQDINPDYSLQSGNIASDPAHLDITIPFIEPVASQSWRIEVDKGTNIQLGGVRIVEVDAIPASLPSLLPPVANIAVNKSSAAINQLITADANDSYDDGTITLYEWDFTNDGVIDASGPTVNFNYTTQGDYTLRLRVTDNDGLIDEATQSISIVTYCDTVPGVSTSDAFDITRGTIVTAHDTLIDPENVFNTCSGFENGHALMRNGGLNSTSFINFETTNDVSLQGIRLFAANDGVANNFRRAMNHFRLLADLDVDNVYETLVVDQDITPDYAQQSGNAAVSDNHLDLTFNFPEVITAQRWRIEVVQGADVQPFEGVRIVEIDAIEMQ